MFVFTKSQPFGQKYARYYDAFHSNKDYPAESKTILDLVSKLRPRASSVLELGCGTGNYTRILSRHFRVTAVDRSAHMLEVAREKVVSQRVRFIRADIAKLPRLRRKFDVCVCMFHVFNYLGSRLALRKVLASVRSLLRRGGILIFDSWNGLAVLRVRPATRVRRVTRQGETVIRRAEPHLNARENLCEIDYEIRIFRGERLIDTFHEKHEIRYLFPFDLKETLQESGFELLQTTSNRNRTLRETDWSMLIVARRK